MDNFISADSSANSQTKLRNDIDRFASEFGWQVLISNGSRVSYTNGSDIVNVNFNGMKADTIFGDKSKETIYRKGLSIYNIRSVFENPSLRTWISWTDSDTLEMQGKEKWVSAKSF